jgi:AcrR family transcriptional regulator
MRPMRADGRRNYERILEAARRAFADHGPEASLEAIARDAGVGSATLHRHFPHRYALMEAAYWSQIVDLCAYGNELADSTEPGPALRRWLSALVELAAERGLAHALVRAPDGEAEGLFDACHSAIRKAGGTLLRRAKAAGEVRRDVSLDDLLQMANAIALAVEHDDDRSRRAARLLRLMADGMS